MTDPLAAWCEVSGQAIENNLRLTRDQIPGQARLCVVLKADAYGHGIGNVVPILRRAGITCIGITSNDEARAVRAADFEGEIIRLRAASPDEIMAARDARVEEQVSSPEVAQCLKARARAGDPVRAHLALNALGMSRDGLELSTETGRVAARQIMTLIGDHIVAVSTHFPNNAADRLHRSAAIFDDHAQWAFRTGLIRRDQCYRHAGSSLTLLSGVQIGTDMYRCGAILFGILAPELGFRASMTLKARIVSITDYPAGATVGYDEAVTLPTPRRLACLSIGYANGVRRSTESRGIVRLEAGIAPIIGKVSMNTLVIDVTGVEGARVGQAAEIFGQGALDAAPNTHAQQQFRTILADLYADWGLRNPRLLV